MKTQVVNIKNSAYDIYIGRGSKWGNPFYMSKESDRAKVIELYEHYARQKFTKTELQELVGKRLGCHCKPKPCHGDVLLKLIYEYELEKDIFSFC